MPDKLWIGGATLALTASFAAVAFGAGNKSPSARVSAGVIAAAILLGGIGLVVT